MNKVTLNLKEKATRQARNLNLRNECTPLMASPPSCAPSQPCHVHRYGLLYLVLVYPDVHSCATIKVGCRISDLIASDTCITGFKDIKRKRNSSPHRHTRLWIPLIPLTSVTSISSLDVMLCLIPQLRNVILSHWMCLTSLIRPIIYLQLHS